MGKDRGLVANACDFRLLEEKCIEYCKTNNIEIPQALST